MTNSIFTARYCIEAFDRLEPVLQEFDSWRGDVLSFRIHTCLSNLREMRRTLSVEEILESLPEDQILELVALKVHELRKILTDSLNQSTLDDPVYNEPFTIVNSEGVHREVTLSLPWSRKTLIRLQTLIDLNQRDETYRLYPAQTIGMKTHAFAVKILLGLEQSFSHLPSSETDQPIEEIQVLKEEFDQPEILPDYELIESLLLLSSLVIQAALIQADLELNNKAGDLSAEEAEKTSLDAEAAAKAAASKEEERETAHNAFLNKKREETEKTRSSTIHVAEEEINETQKEKTKADEKLQAELEKNAQLQRDIANTRAQLNQAENDYQKKVAENLPNSKKSKCFIL